MLAGIFKTALRFGSVGFGAAAGLAAWRPRRGLFNVALVMLTALLWQLHVGALSHAVAQDDGGDVVKRAAQARATGDDTRAIQLLTEALSKARLANDRRASLLNDRAFSYARIGETQKAFDDFNASARLFPENAALYNNRGAVLSALGLHAEALKDLDRAITLAPGYGAAYANRGLAEIAAGRIAGGLMDMRKAVALFENKAAPLIRRARFHLDQKRPNAALRDLDRALGFDARNALGYRLRAQARIALGDDDAALEDLSRTIAFAPNDVDAHLMRGGAYMRRGDFQAAITDFTKVLTLAPDTADGWRQRGHAHILVNNVDEAESDLNRALSLGPRSGQAETFAYRALLFKKKAEPEQGQREIQAAEQIDAANPVVLWARGEIEEAVGNTDAAVDSYRAALERDPQLTPAQLGLARLGKAAPQSEEVVSGAGKDGWEVVAAGNRFYARSARFEGINVPLEPFGQVAPAIAGWEEQRSGRNSVGVLTVIVGSADTRAARDVPIASAALIDLRRSRLLATVPGQIGSDKSKVTIEDNVLKVDAVDGLVDRMPLTGASGVASVTPDRRDVRSRSPRRQVRQRRRRRSADNGVPYWAPWANQSGSRNRSRGRRSRRSRRKPKTLFDLFLGN